jgi:hypothetical protein
MAGVVIHGARPGWRIRRPAVGPVAVASTAFTQPVPL